MSRLCLLDGTKKHGQFLRFSCPSFSETMNYMFTNADRPSTQHYDTETQIASCVCVWQRDDLRIFSVLVETNDVFVRVIHSSKGLCISIIRHDLIKIEVTNYVSDPWPFQTLLM